MSLSFQRPRILLFSPYSFLVLSAGHFTAVKFTFFKRSEFSKQQAANGHWMGLAHIYEAGRFVQSRQVNIFNYHRQNIPI